MFSCRRDMRMLISRRLLTDIPSWSWSSRDTGHRYRFMKVVVYRYVQI